MISLIDNRIYLKILRMQRASKRPRVAQLSKARRLRGVRAAVRSYSARVKGPVALRPGPELKFVDVAQANYVADTTGTVTLLNGVAVGDDYTSRDGRQITIKSVQVRGRCQPIDAGTLPTHARVLLVWDNAASGGAPTIAQILSASTSNSFPLVDNQARFTILRDMSFFVGGVSNTATQAYAMSPTGHIVDTYLRIGQITQFNGTGATNIANGALYMVTIGDQAAGDGAQFSLATRVRFSEE